MDGTTADGVIEIALSNDLREIPAAAARLDGFCAVRGISPEVAYAINLALEELLTNTIGHGYDDEDLHRIEVIVRQEGETLVVVVVDDGKPFDPTQVPQADFAPSLDGGDESLGGLGLLLVNRMMDSVEYRRRADCNVVVLSKSIAATEQTD